jgi:hypothetical protein
MRYSGGLRGGSWLTAMTSGLRDIGSPIIVFTSTEANVRANARA